MSDEKQTQDQAVNFQVTDEGIFSVEGTPESLEIVRRIQACVIACEGITTEELENDIVQDMKRVIGQVIPLLEERNQMENMISQGQSNPGPSGPHQIQATQQKTV